MKGIGNLFRLEKEKKKTIEDRIIRDIRKPF